MPLVLKPNTKIYSKKRTTHIPSTPFSASLSAILHALCGASSQSHTSSLHLISISICSCVSCTQLPSSSRSIRPVVCAVEMDHLFNNQRQHIFSFACTSPSTHLVQNTSRTVKIISSTSRRFFWESPISIVRAGNDSVVAWHGVEQRGTVSAVTILVGAVDCWGCGLYTDYVVVDAADGGFLGGGDEPGCEITV